MNRETIIERLIAAQNRRSALAISRATNDSNDSEVLDQLHTRDLAFLASMRSELEKRLTQATYLTCRDFRYLDCKCCPSCHGCYAQYDMSILTLSGRSAWVCGPIADVLSGKPPAKLAPEIEAIFADIVGPKSAEERNLLEAWEAAVSDDDALVYCLRYVHYIYGRKNKRRTIEEILSIHKKRCLAAGGVLAEVSLPQGAAD